MNPSQAGQALPIGWEERRQTNGQVIYYDRITKEETLRRPLPSDYAEKLIEEALPAGWTRILSATDGIYYKDSITSYATRRRPRESDHPTGRTMFVVPPPSRTTPRPYRLPSRNAERFAPSFSYLYEHTNRSGFTPPASLSPKRPLSPVSDMQATPFNEYPNYYMRGFSLGELHDVEAIDAYNTGVGISTLSNSILPLLKNNWVTPGRRMLGKPGRFWDLNDPEVSMAMDPILRLVSRFLVTLQTNDWWDALVAGPRFPIELHRIPVGITEPLQSFKRRSPQQKLTNPVDWNYFNGRIDFAFGGGLDFDDQSESLVSMDYGETLDNRKKKSNAKLILSHNCIEALMPSFTARLPNSERLVLIFIAAVTLLHEFAHAIESSRTHDDPATWHYPPYFEDESVPEQGHSMESAVFGGAFDSFPNQVREIAFLGVKAQGLKRGTQRLLGALIKPWPYLGAYGGGPILNFDKSPAKWAIHPVTLAYIEDIQQDLYWDVEVVQFGFQALEVWDKIFGRLHPNPRSQANSYRHKGSDLVIASTFLDQAGNWRGPPINQGSDPSASISIPVAIRVIPNFVPNSQANRVSAYRAIRARQSYKIARAVHARIKASVAREKVYLQQSPGSSIKVYEVKRRNEQDRDEYKAFYQGKDDELEDLMKSKGVTATDLGIQSKQDIDRYT